MYLNQINSCTEMKIIRIVDPPNITIKFIQFIKYYGYHLRQWIKIAKLV